MNKSPVSRDENIERGIIRGPQEFAILQMSPPQKRSGHDVVAAEPIEANPQLVRKVVVQQHLHSPRRLRAACANETSCWISESERSG